MVERKPVYDRSSLLVKYRLRICEVAFLLECHPDTVREWMARGKIEFKRTPGGERKVLTDSIRPYL